MRCPTCKSHQVRVIDSRMVGEDKRRRRYECQDCKDRFTTYETNVGDAYSLDEIRAEVRLHTIEEIMDTIMMKKGE